MPGTEQVGKGALPIKLDRSQQVCASKLHDFPCNCDVVSFGLIRRHVYLTIYIGDYHRIKIDTAHAIVSGSLA